MMKCEKWHFDYDEGNEHTEHKKISLLLFIYDGNFVTDSANCVINMVRQEVKVIRAMVRYLQAIGAHHHRVIEEARNKGHDIARAVVRIDLVRARIRIRIHIHMTQEERDATNIHIDEIAVIIVPDIEGVESVANDVPHQETIDAEANQTNVDATTIDREN